MSESALKPAGGLICDFGVEDDVEVGSADPANVLWRCAQRGDKVHLDAEGIENLADLDQIVAVAEAQRGRAKDVGTRLSAFTGFAHHRLVG